VALGGWGEGCIEAVEEGDCVGAVGRGVHELVGQFGVEGGEAAEDVDEAGAELKRLVLVRARTTTSRCVCRASGWRPPGSRA
jgi:hypothetical protein